MISRRRRAPRLTTGFPCQRCRRRLRRRSLTCPAGSRCCTRQATGRLVEPLLHHSATTRWSSPKHTPSLQRKKCAAASASLSSAGKSEDRPGPEWTPQRHGKFKRFLCGLSELERQSCDTGGQGRGRKRGPLWPDVSPGIPKYVPINMFQHSSRSRLAYFI